MKLFSNKNTSPELLSFSQRESTLLCKVICYTGEKPDITEKGTGMQDLDKALADLGDIRSRLAVGTTFQGFGPAVIAITSVMALVLGLAQVGFPMLFSASIEAYLVSWVLLAVMCSVLIGAEMIARSRRIHGGLADAMLVQAIEHFLPAAAAGAVLTFVVYSFASDLLWTLPGLWQLVLSLGIFASARTLVRRVKLVAAWYFVCAFVVFVLSIEQTTLSPWLMAVPFAIGQLLMAFVLKTSGDTNHGE